MLGILVETRSHTDAIGKFDAHRASRFGCKTWRRKLRDAERRCAVQRSKGNLVRRLGVDGKKQRAEQRIQLVHRPLLKRRR